MDGAIGTMLQKQGMQPGMCPELFGLEHPEVLADIHYHMYRLVPTLLKPIPLAPITNCRLTD